MTTTTNAHAPTITSEPTFIHTAFETWLAYERSDKTHVDLSIVHRTDVTQLTIGILDNDPDSENCDEQLSGVELGIPEARLLRNFLNLPEIVAILEGEAKQ